jgi:hypothetical protein
MNHGLIAEEAIRLLTPSIEVLLREKAKRTDMHVVIMDPTLKPWESSFEDAVLLEHSFTERSGWENPYDELARAKAEQAWRLGRSNRELFQNAPALLRDGDVAFYGSFEYEGVIVAASGVEAWYDVLVSGWIATAVQQLAQAEFQTWKEANPAGRYID